MLDTRPTLALLALCGALLLRAAPATAQPLIQNGGFETGNFTSWTTQTLGNGGFFIGDTSQPDGFGGYLTPGTGLSSVGPSSGSFFAVSDASDPDNGGPGARALLQAFTTPASFSSLTLSYDMFVNDWNGAGALNTGGLLDPNQPDPTQYARVDILTGGADPFSTKGGDIVQNLFLGEDAGNPPNLYTSYNFDLTSLLAPNTTYLLRFAEVDNQFVINQGVDNVSLVAVASATDATPEPGATTLFAGLLGSFTCLLWRRRRQCQSIPVR